MDGRSATERRGQDGRRDFCRAVARAARGRSGETVAPRLLARLETVVGRLPPLEGRRIRIRFRPSLHARGGRLVSRGLRGEAVHAGSMLRKRLIVFETELLESPRELARILLHELFHFVWLRAGNPARRSWELVLASEFQAGARGELGWSAELRKSRLSSRDVSARTRRWRDYACESFCDSAAWLCAGCREHDEFTLAQKRREPRRRWFKAFLARPSIPV